MTQQNSQKTTKFCQECGESILKKAEICPKCGVRQQTEELRTPRKKDKVTAALLAIVFGGIGLHKFYLEDIGMGLIYLIFFWTFIPAIFGVLEGIVYISMTEKDFDKKYNYR